MKTVIGDPDPKHVSNSFVERQNLTMRMGMRRFTRLTNGFSKKLENHAHMVALHFLYYNFGRLVTQQWKLASQIMWEPCRYRCSGLNWAISFENCWSPHETLVGDRRQKRVPEITISVIVLGQGVFSKFRTL
jgi:hypothetical protein